MEFKTLSELCDIVSGGTPSRSRMEFWNNGDIPWIKIGNLNGKYVEKADEYIAKVGLENSAAKVLPKGTILYTIFATLGETAILSIDACTNQAIAGICIKDNLQVSTDYIYYFLKSKKKFVNNIGRGVAQNNINMSILKAFKVPLPEYSVQSEIVDILDKTVNIINMRQAELEKLDRLVKARFVEMFGDIKANPYGFEKMALKDTCTVITGNTPSRSVPEYYGDSIEWIKTDNIVSGRLSPSQALEYLSDEGIKVGRTVEKGAILMACIAGSVESIGRVCVTDRKVAFNQQINAIVPEDYDTLFLHTMLQLSKEYLVEEINMALKGILSKSKLEGKEFIVPSIEQQEQFAPFVAQVNKSKVVSQHTTSNPYIQNLNFAVK